MRTTNTLILGGGQAGLAISRCLTALGCDHLVIERGRIAERWHSERWNSLRLLTPNWMTRLPGWTYHGPDPDGFMTAPEVASFFARLRRLVRRPGPRNTRPCNASPPHADGFVVTTSDGQFRSDNVVIATGWCDRPAIPGVGRHLSSRIHQVVPADYRSPDDVASGGVLVVGASATGVQLADELHRSGRHVTLAVGSHSRIPRRYRGLDIFRWLDMIGAFDKTIDDVGDVTAARNRAVAATGGPRRSPHPRPGHIAGLRRPPRRPTERRGRNPGHAGHQPARPSSTPPTARRPASWSASTPPSNDSA